MPTSLPVNEPNKEWSRVWHHTPLDIGLIQAHYIRHAYPPHIHDYYVVCVIESGFQSFRHHKQKFLTTPGGVILINPGVVHTGEPADVRGFSMRALYPTAAHLEQAAFELTGRHQALPFFGTTRVNDRATRERILACHRALTEGGNTLEIESRFLVTLTELVREHAELRHPAQHIGREERAVERARRYIEENFAEGITLHTLAEHVALSPYYLIRVFRAEVGIPPHAFLDSVRIRHAQRLIEAGKPLAVVSAEAGFSSQSHLTRRFKQIIGATPGQYARTIRAH